MNDSKIKYNEQITKRCRDCGEELPIEKFAINHVRNGVIQYRNRCKKCHNKYKRDLYVSYKAPVKQNRVNKISIKRCKQNISEKNKRQIIAEDENLKIPRHYKNILPQRILDIDNTGISLISSDEIFVKLIDYRDVWISNYGRIISRCGQRYSIMRKKYNKNEEIVYALYENVYNGKTWTYKKKIVDAWKLVVQTFIVNYDIANNTCCWHKNNDKTNNYYKHLYPLNTYQYNEVKEYFEEAGNDSEQLILDIVNNVDYKSDGWKVLKMKRTISGIGYLGCNDARTSSRPIEYVKWGNMMNRCYNPNVHKNKPYYKPCTVCEEWYNYANFREWYRKNNIPGKKFDLDKDILIQGNTEYSPETCSLVSHFTNTVFESRGIQTNIIFNRDTGKYDVAQSILGNRKEIGSYDTEKDARQAFAEYKRSYIHNFAKKSKNKVPSKVYDAMMNWKIEVDD